MKEQFKSGECSNLSQIGLGAGRSASQDRGLYRARRLVRAVPVGPLASCQIAAPSASRTMTRLDFAVALLIAGSIYLIAVHIGIHFVGRL